MSASNVKLIMQPEIYYQVHRLVHSISHDPNLYEDLLQEASLCFWRAQATHPGQKTSWYRQRCRFSIYGYLGAGRSVDSLKHRGPTCTSDGSRALDSVAADDILQAICAGDAFNELACRLDAAELEDTSLYFHFKDLTNGNKTYPNGRYLYTEPMGKDGQVFLDFNKAHNPPSAFTQYAICTFAAELNHLKVSIEAGELYAGHK